MICLAVSALGSPPVVTAVDASVCAPGEFSALSPAETAQLLANPFVLDNDAAVAIAVATFMVMAVAFVFRLARPTVDGPVEYLD